MKCLLVEDEPIFHEIWRYLIRNIDDQIELICVDSVEKAEDLIKVSEGGLNSFGLVISDIYVLGKKNGIDFWNEFFVDSGDNVPPFLLVSSLSLGHLLKGLKESWACPAYIQKPFDPRDCYPLIKSLIYKNAS